MVLWGASSPHLLLLGLLSILLHPNVGIRLGIVPRPSPVIPNFREDPAFQNGDQCGSGNTDDIHVAMTLDANYIRGTMAAVFSLLQHSTCPENLKFHFLSASAAPELFSRIKSTFPYLSVKTYAFDSNRVRGKISRSIRRALDQPTNYARIYLAHILPSDMRRVIYLDSDLVVVDDIAKLWGVDMENKVVAAPEYCQANFTQYFTDALCPTRICQRRSPRKKAMLFQHRTNGYGCR
ncbi:hypothetical protein ACLB2K_037474 [Fragaria x ananassa]